MSITRYGVRLDDESNTYGLCEADGGKYVTHEDHEDHINRVICRLVGVRWRASEAAATFAKFAAIGKQIAEQDSLWPERKIYWAAVEAMQAALADAGEP